MVFCLCTCDVACTREKNSFFCDFLSKYKYFNIEIGNTCTLILESTKQNVKIVCFFRYFDADMRRCMLSIKIKGFWCISFLTCNVACVVKKSKVLVYFLLGMQRCMSS